MSGNSNDDDIHLPDLGDQPPENSPSIPPTGTRRARVEDDDEDMFHEQRERNRPRIQVDSPVDPLPPQTTPPRVANPQPSNPVTATATAEGQAEAPRGPPRTRRANICGLGII
jgi:hypothetical protein